MTQIQIGDFITIPAWAATGQVIAVESAWYGSDDAQRVLLQDAPEARPRWYALEPDQFNFV